VRPDLPVDEQTARHGADLWATDPGMCCHLRKVLPMQRALARFDAWITGIRRTQTAIRSQTPVITYDPQFGVIKVCPLLNATDDDIKRYLTQHKLPRNPLLNDGYASLGCMPCTSPVRPGENPRAGRWRGLGKTECGLHGRRNTEHMRRGDAS
jgi:phosphoadenosine phosphosulfate reductase